MYIQEKTGNNENVKRILNTYPPLFKNPASIMCAGFLYYGLPS